MTIIYRILWAWGGAAVLGLTSLAVAEVADARYRYTFLTLLVLAAAILAAWALTAGVCNLAPHVARAWLAAHGVDISTRRDGWDLPPAAARPTPPVLDLSPSGAAVLPEPEPEEEPDPHKHCCHNRPEAVDEPGSRAGRGAAVEASGPAEPDEPTTIHPSVLQAAEEIVRELRGDE